MGGGRDDAGRWRRDEDFRWAGEFAEFLRAIDSQHRSTVDLVLNGDTFEPPTSDEAEAHRQPGPGAGGAQGGGSGAGIVRESRHQPDRPDSWRSRFGPALREGRRARDACACAAPPIASRPHPRATGFRGTARCMRSMATRSASARRIQGALQELYDTARSDVPGCRQRRHRSKRREVRGSRPTTRSSSGEAVALLVRDALLNVSWQQFRMELDDGDVQPPQWDLAQARSLGASLLAASLPDDDPLKPLAAALDAKGGLAAVARDLTDQELTALCDYRAAVRRARRRFEPLVTQFAPRGPAVAECPRTPDTRGAIFDYFWRSRDAFYDGYVERARRRSNGRRSGGVRDRPHASRRPRPVVRQHDQRRPAQDSDGRLLTRARRADAGGHQRRRVEPDDHAGATGTAEGRARTCRGTISCNRSSPKSSRPATPSFTCPPTSRIRHPPFAIGAEPTTAPGASRPPAAADFMSRET